MSGITKARLIWEGVEIKVNHHPGYCRRVDGVNDLDHIELHVISPEGHPLPVTETGYRSIFEMHSAIERHGGALAYVETMLNHAKTEDRERWEAQVADFGQMELEL